jgi:hypothetical protein
MGGVALRCYVRSINLGEGGYAEDHEYFGELANV